MSRKKKVPVEDLRTSLENILSFFSPIELKIKSGKIFLPEIMSEAISNAKSLVILAEKNKSILPESTINLARFGSTIENIANNYEDYIEYKRVKKMSQRKGAFYIEIPSWDRRRLENELKKSKKSKVKGSSDQKFFQELIIPYRNLISERDELFTKFSKEFLDKMKLFANPISNIYSHLLKGKAHFHELKSIKEGVSSGKEEIDHLNSSIIENSNELTIVNEKLDNYWNDFYQTSTGGLYKRKEKDIQNLVRTNPLSQFLDTIKELIEAFDKFIQKQQIQITHENQELLNKLKESLIDPISNLSTHFPEFINFYLVFSDDVFGKKLNKKPEFSDKSFLLSSPGWKAWLQEQQFAQDLYQLKSTNDYNNLIKNIETLNNKKTDIASRLETMKTKLSILKQNIEDMSQQEELAFKTLIDWMKEQ